MAGLTPLPQTVLHSSTRLTHGEAHSLLSSFLETAETNPSYRPDAILTQHGAQAAGVGAQSNLTLNHLNRILQGIAGKRVGGLDFEPARKKRRLEDGENGEELPSSPPVIDGRTPKAKRGRRDDLQEVVEAEDGDETGEAAVVGEGRMGWQDKEEFEHAQVDETEDIGGRDPADPADGIEASVDEQLAGGSLTEQPMGQAEKELRKQAKKDRRKKEKQDRNEKKKG